MRSQKDYIERSKAPFLVYFPSELQRNSNLKLLKLRRLTRSRINSFLYNLIGYVNSGSHQVISLRFLINFVINGKSSDAHISLQAPPQNSLLSALLLVILAVWQISMQRILLISLTVDLYPYSNGSIGK